MHPVILCKKAAKILVAVGITVVLCAYTQKQTPLLQVDGCTVYEQEYRTIMQQNVAETVRHFQTTYDTEYSHDFWDKQYDDQTPKDYLFHCTVDDIKYNKVQEQLLAEKNLLTFQTYEEFLHLLEQENQRRSHAIAAGEVIYGPTTYDEWEYYQYLMANQIQELKRLYIKEGLIQPTQENLQAFYQANPELVSQPYDTLTLQTLEFPYVYQDGKVHPDQKEQARLAANKALELLNQQHQELVQIPSTVSQAVYAEKIFSNESARTDSLMMSQVFQWAMQAQQGQQSEVLEDNGAYWIVCLKQRQEAQQVPFEQVADYINTKYVDEQFETIVQNKLAQAKVNVLVKELPFPQED